MRALIDLRTRRTCTLLVSSTVLALVLSGPVAGPAEAARPDASPFAGAYWWGMYSVTISEGGRVAGSYSYDWCYYSCVHHEGELRGQVTADGAISLKVTEWSVHVSNRTTYAVTGHVTPDAEGNLVFVTDGGATLTWYRQ